MSKKRKKKDKRKRPQSPYSIGLYVKCPKQYYFEYLDSYTSVYPHKQELKRIPLEAGERRELVFGEILHNVLNDFFHLPEKDRTKKALATLLKEMWTKDGKARGKEGGFPDIKEEREWYKEALDILQNFYNTQDLSPDIAYLPETERDGKFIEANFLKVPLNSDVTVAGKIDRIDKGKDGSHIIDYKTGKSERDDGFQLMVYAILAEEALGKPPTKGSYLYLRTGNIKSFDVTEESKAAAKEKVLEVAEKIRNEREFTPNPTKICAWCDYIEFCPAKKEAKKLIAEYKGEEVEELPF